jgi:hypothetical protein
MKAADLIKRLETLAPDTEVYIASDEEWNSIREVYAVDYGWLMDDGYEVHGVADEDVGSEYDESELTRGATLW